MTGIAFYWPILVIILSNTFYQLSAKSNPAAMNPLASLTVSYAVAALTSLVLYYISSPVKSLLREYGQLNVSVFLLGICIVGLEFGSIYMYKVGWNVSTGSLVASIGLAVVMILLGTTVFHETMTFNKIIGVVLCLAGLYFINK